MFRSGGRWAALLFFTVVAGCGGDPGRSPLDAPMDAAEVDGGADGCVNCCGNQRVEGSEACDDGNQADFDGCSALCLFERTLIVQTAVVVPPTDGCDLDGDGAIDN